MPASVLLVSTNPAEQQPLADVLQPAGYTVVIVADPEQALATASQHDLLILDMTADIAAVLDICRRSRQDPAIAAVPLLCIAPTDDVEDRIRFLEAGADDVIGRPYDGRELEARVEALVVRFQRSRGAAILPGEDGPSGHERRTVGVFSPKGGQGSTTIATNVAVVAAMRRPDAVLLIDLDLQFGGVAIHLDLTPRQTIVDLVKDEAALADPELLRGYATRHESGLHLLAGPARPADGAIVTEAAVDQLLATAALAYEAVVIDAGSHLDARTLRVLDWVDSLIVPFVPEIPALKAVHSLLDYLNDQPAVIAKSILVLNNAFARQALRMRDIELALGTNVAVELPYDSIAYLNSANEGIPVVSSAPRSSAAMLLTSLAATAFGDAVPPPVSARGRSRFSGLLRRSGASRPDR